MKENCSKDPLRSASLSSCLFFSFSRLIRSHSACCLDISSIFHFAPSSVLDFSLSSDSFDGYKTFEYCSTRVLNRPNRELVGRKKSNSKLRASFVASVCRNERPRRAVKSAVVLMISLYKRNKHMYRSGILQYGSQIDGTNGW